jgi:hypothetical protein
MIDWKFMIASNMVIGELSIGVCWQQAPVQNKPPLKYHRIMVILYITVTIVVYVCAVGVLCGG